MILFLVGLYFGGFIYVAAVAAADEQCPDLVSALISALTWPYGLYEVVKHLGGGKAL